MATGYALTHSFKQPTERRLMMRTKLSHSLPRFAGVVVAAFALGACATNEQLISGPEPTNIVESDRNSHMQLATAARAGGDYATAIRLLRRTVDSHPLDVEPLIELGDTLHEARAYDKAIEAFERARFLAPKNQLAHSGLGRANLGLRQPYDALKHFDEALRIAPQDLVSMNGRAVALDMVGRHDEAQDTYRQALDLQPRNHLVQNNLALSLLLTDRYGEAVEILERLSFAPDATPQMRQNLALAYGLMGDMEVAAQVARMDLDPGMVENNLRFYQVIRAHSNPQLRSAPLVSR
ncbi:MAG: tetratricopeptide repeat protein [Alphaproteobacteria bacterium]